MWTWAPIPMSRRPVLRPAAPRPGPAWGPTKIDAVLGVAKVYSTRVGSGPFPTELTDEVGAGLQERGKEFGATTGRARRCGWFDVVVVRYATIVNGFTSLAMTKLDVLDGCKELKVCTGYRYQGQLYRDMPADLQTLTDCEPVYKRFKGWSASTTGVTTYKARFLWKRSGIFNTLKNRLNVRSI